MNGYKIYITLLMAAMLFFSCSEDPDLLIKKGDYEKAIISLKEELSKDYKNTSLRNKITKLYFTNAERNISDNDLDEAERNIERGIIYSDETNPEIKDGYAEILVQLGSKLIESGDSEGSVDQKKNYEKGIKLLKKAVQLSEENKKALEILNSIKEQNASRFYNSALEYYNLWYNDKRNTDYLSESQKQLQLSTEIMKLPDADQFRNKLLESFLSINLKNTDFDIRFLNIYFNSENGFVAFRIRLYNNTVGDIVVSPAQFTLYDMSDNSYRFDSKAVSTGNYKGVMEKFRINPDRFATGLLVFDTGFKKDPVFSRIVWRDEFGNTCVKNFPSISITEIELQ